HRRPRWPWALTAALVALLLIWLVSRSPGESSSQSPTPASTAQMAGPPWKMGNPEGRFTLTLYADLECPFCREYFPQLKRWVG
ncbi:thioredoxin domain-containing protein, partial [Pseudomonas aeruginosa]